MKKTLALLLTLGLGTATLFAYGGSGKHMMGKHKNCMMKIVKKLDLTSEQKSELKKLREANKAERKAKKEAMKAKRKEMKASMKPDMSQFMTANHFDKEAFKTHMNAKFEAKRQMMESRKAQMLEKRANNMEKVFTILTPEQRIKWIELSKQKGEYCEKSSKCKKGKNCDRD